MEFFEIGATIFGLLQGLLVMLNKRCNWIAYITQMILMVVFSLSVNLYGDALNSFCYIFIGIIGFIVWNKKEKEYIGVCSWKERIIYIFLILLGTYIGYLVLNKTDDPLPLIDAFTTVSSFVATYYINIKKIDTWIIWFINDIFYCLTYWLLPDQALYLFTLNLLWTFMAIGSFFNWYKIRKNNTINKLYCAGAFSFDYLEKNYKKKEKMDYRAKILGNINLLLAKQDYVILKPNLYYIGPFYFETDGMIDELIVKEEIKMIKNCTHIIFLLDSGCCPGTIAELIFAVNLKKDISIFYIKRKDNEETESDLHTPCWFPIIISKLNNKNTKIIRCKDYNEATKKIKKYIENFN